MKLNLPLLAALAFTFASSIGLSQAQETSEFDKQVNSLAKAAEARELYRTQKIPVTNSPPVKVVMETSKGTIEIELDAAKASGTVANFVKYVKKGHFDGTIFHRVIPGFMIQGGGFTADMNQKSTDAPIKNEANNDLKNTRGTLAMARTSKPDSASSQFFINLKDNTFLDFPGQDGWGYCVFGKVTKGIEIVDQIAAVPTGSKGGHQNVPTEPVLIKSAKISE